ncbi:hypothetical protein OPV22_009016 [Ensete ventricosum]|uniref:Uncharacterized protein n=1 Tax=Ensete ventricosum TaxID=4639 RepID=A0AAV8RG04_ENSVE|nr:hypothetical protein OPV22_009016 [Ensete ventricosum]
MSVSWFCQCYVGVCNVLDAKGNKRRPLHWRLLDQLLCFVNLKVTSVMSCIVVLQASQSRVNFLLCLVRDGYSKEVNQMSLFIEVFNCLQWVFALGREKTFKTLTTRVHGTFKLQCSGKEY